MSPRRLLLASTSRYRRALLERLQLDFTAEPPGVEETYLAAEAPAVRAERLAQAKARAVAERHPEAIVIGSDQVAARGAEIFDKPGGVPAACAQLARLSGQAVEFHTAVAVCCTERGFLRTHLDTTRVIFRALSPQEIERYVGRERPLDTAGSFKSEGLGIALLSRIEATDPTALIGLPLIWVAATLRELGLCVP